MITNNLCDFVTDTNIIPAIKTDHAAIILTLGGIGEVRGPGMWKMNVSILDDEQYLDSLRVNFPKWKAQGEKDLSDTRLAWNWIKYNIRKHAIDYSREKGRQRKD